MPVIVNALPEAPTQAAAMGDGAWQNAVDTAIGWATAIPANVWVGLLLTLFVATVVSFPFIRHQARKAGARTAAGARPSRKEAWLLAGVLTPAVLFWLAVLVGSGRSLIQFGREDLNWHNGWEYLVPFTLDGVAVAFGALAFRAVAKGRNPDRAYRVVWMSTTTSAVINFFHEIGGSTLGAGYLAVLSLFGMLIFHELLAQFEEGAAWIKRVNPVFGLRWLTWPTNTMCAWFAWRNYPPTDGTDATVAVAVKHLETVRTDKAARRAQKFGTAPWWAPIVPWARVAQLDAALADTRSQVETERARVARTAADRDRSATEINARTADLVARFEADMEQARTDTNERITALQTEHRAALAAERNRTLLAEQAADNARTDAAQQMERLRAEHAAQVSRIRERTPRSAPAPARTSAKPPTGAVTGESRLSNDEAVELMLATHPERSYEWSQREVVRLTGAGFSRAPKLIAAVAERHARQDRTGGSEGSDDDLKERSA